MSVDYFAPCPCGCGVVRWTVTVGGLPASGLTYVIACERAR